jgi:hypothetical protein
MITAHPVVMCLIVVVEELPQKPGMSLCLNTFILRKFFEQTIFFFLAGHLSHY